MNGRVADGRQGTALPDLRTPPACTCCALCRCHSSACDGDHPTRCIRCEERQDVRRSCAHAGCCCSWLGMTHGAACGHPIRQAAMHEGAMHEGAGSPLHGMTAWPAHAAHARVASLALAMQRMSLALLT